MISSDVINTDKFLSLPLATRGLYMHLNCEADDDGFIASALRTTRAVDGTAEMLDELVSSEYLIRFDSGIYLIRHWLLHNSLKKDRYTPTIYINELGKVEIRDKVYFLLPETEWNQIGSKPEPQVSIEKKSKNIKKKNRFADIEQSHYDIKALEQKLLQLPPGKEACS